MTTTASHIKQWRKNQGGTIHLSGELDFPANQQFDKLKKQLKQKEEDTEDLLIKTDNPAEIEQEIIEVYPPITGQKFVIFKDEDTGKVEKVSSYNKNLEVVDRLFLR